MCKRERERECVCAHARAFVCARAKDVSPLVHEYILSQQREGSEEREKDRERERERQRERQRERDRILLPPFPSFVLFFVRRRLRAYTQTDIVKISMVIGRITGDGIIIINQVVATWEFPTQGSPRPDVSEQATEPWILRSWSLALSSSTSLSACVSLTCTLLSLIHI